ncbi:hypothetical protein [Mesorhizobium sp. ANAO-SY3R2]|uniref:hypothetical protein n=1 Tax=Mesorhizobium sp. ANAO-SY3R2 TaxID=3166644 RepID=UPI003671E831
MHRGKLPTGRRPGQRQGLRKQAGRHDQLTTRMGTGQKIVQSRPQIFLGLSVIGICQLPKVTAAIDKIGIGIALTDVAVIDQQPLGNRSKVRKLTVAPASAVQAATTAQHESPVILSSSRTE